MQLLLEADPSPEKVSQYLENSRCYAAQTSERIAAICVVQDLDEDELIKEKAEIYNIATDPKHQGLGIGRALLGHVIQQERERGLHHLVLGTGSFGYQLAFYQSFGFRVVAVIKDFFIDHYDAPIFEAGLQHKDMLRLELNLCS